MKTVGIALLFGLCALIGVRLGAKKTARLKTVRSLRSDLQLFSERIAAGSSSLPTLAAERDGLFSELLQSYLDALPQGYTEVDAAEQACERLQGQETVRAGLRQFLSGLSSAARSDLVRRTQLLSSVLDRAETEAEAEARQARVIKVSGVLAGTGLAILLW